MVGVRGLLRKQLKIVLNILVFLDTWLSFVPLIIMNYFLGLLVKSKSEIDYIKRTYTLFAISSALVGAGILAILWRIFDIHGLILYILMVLYTAFVLNVSWIAYRFDPTIEIAHLGNEESIKKFTDRLMHIKLWAFYIFIFILATIFP